MSLSSFTRAAALMLAATCAQACSDDSTHAGGDGSVVLDGGAGDGRDLAGGGSAGGAPDRAPPVGATTPFVSYEAETGPLGAGATAVALTAPPTTQFSSPALEASGHAYVHLAATGQYVEWTNRTAFAVSFI